MATGMSEYLCDSWLNALCNATSFSVTTVYMQLHTGEPGAAGTANVATETDRMTVSFGAPGAPAAGVVTISNDAQVQWTSIAGSQDATHYSLWDASTSGNYLGSGTVTASAYTAGDTLTFAIGDIDLSLNVATT
jgi:hypothetical protein